jgi:hypothetical protein
MTADPDTLTADSNSGSEPVELLTHFRAADAAHDHGEAMQRAHLLDRLRQVGLAEPVLRALASHPTETSHLARILDAASFAQDPEANASARVQALAAALQAGGALAGRLTTAAAGKAAGVARRAAVAARNERILKLAATVGQNVSETRRWQIVRSRMGRYAPSVATIRRVVKGQ